MPSSSCELCPRCAAFSAWIAPSPISPFADDLYHLQCEHHIHIEGTLEPAMLFSLVEKHKVTLDPAMYSTIEALEER